MVWAGAWTGLGGLGGGAMAAFLAGACDLGAAWCPLCLLADRPARGLLAEPLGLALPLP